MKKILSILLLCLSFAGYSQKKLVVNAGGVSSSQVAEQIEDSLLNILRKEDSTLYATQTDLLETVPPSGAFVATISNESNCTATLPGTYVYWYQAGNMVTAFGKVEIDPSSATTETYFEMDLPVAVVGPLSVNSENCSGHATSYGINGEVYTIYGNGSNGVVFKIAECGTTDAYFFQFRFSYQFKN